MGFAHAAIGEQAVFTGDHGAFIRNRCHPFVVRPAQGIRARLKFREVGGPVSSQQRIGVSQSVVPILLQLESDASDRVQRECQENTPALSCQTPRLFGARVYNRVSSLTNDPIIFSQQCQTNGRSGLLYWQQ